jgi:hypothetical protein
MSRGAEDVVNAVKWALENKVPNVPLFDTQNSTWSSTWVEEMLPEEGITDYDQEYYGDYFERLRIIIKRYDLENVFNFVSKYSSYLYM